LEIEATQSGGALQVVRSSLIRTARALFRGEVLIPTRIWDGSMSDLPATDAPMMEHA